MNAVLRTLLSDDLPRSRWLAAALVLIFVALALAPFLFPGAKSLNVAVKICVFIVLAASYDLLLGYTGIVSFGGVTGTGPVWSIPNVCGGSLREPSRNVRGISMFGRGIPAGIGRTISGVTVTSNSPLFFCSCLV